MRRQRWTHHQPMPIVSSPPKRMALHQSAGRRGVVPLLLEQDTPARRTTRRRTGRRRTPRSRAPAPAPAGPIAEVDQHRHVLAPAALVPPVVHDGGREPGGSLLERRVTPWRSPWSGPALPTARSTRGAPMASRTRRCWRSGLRRALVRGRRSRRGRGREHGGSRAEASGPRHDPSGAGGAGATPGTAAPTNTTREGERDGATAGGRVQRVDQPDAHAAEGAGQRQQRRPGPSADEPDDGGAGGDQRSPAEQQHPEPVLGAQGIARHDPGEHGGHPAGQPEPDGAAAARAPAGSLVLGPGQDLALTPFRVSPCPDATPRPPAMPDGTPRTR